MIEPTLVDTPRLYPGACIDGNQGGPVIDTHYDLEPAQAGHVYLSRQMLRDSTRLMTDLVDELASERGWVPPIIHETETRRLSSQVVELQERLAELEPVERAIGRAAALYRTDL